MNLVQKLLTENIGLWTGADTAKKSGRGRASGGAGTVYGIKKLRELILELAVRGKLVPQDSSDEPASALLERIGDEKARLIRDGKIKKDKPQAAITDDESLFGLPKGWVWCQLGNVCSYIQRGKGPDYVENSDFLVISQKCVRWAGLDLAQVRFFNPESFGKYESIRLLCEGDVLWNSTGTGTIGRACLVPPLDNKKILVADSHVTVVRPIVFSELYLLRWLQSPSVQSKIDGLASGTTNQIELNTSTVIAHLFPLPPLVEQHRIVAKVDELMMLCDQLEAGHTNAADAHEKLVSHLLATLSGSKDSADFSASWQRIATHFDMLFTTEASIDALKQTLLQLAVMGKLVPQDPSDEPASTLLERIQAEKAKLVFEGKIKKDKLLAAISDEEKPFELQQGWEWVRLDQLSHVGTGATPLRTNPEYFDPPAINWVTSGETSSSHIFETAQYVSPLAIKETNLTIYPSGTLIVAMYGQGKTRGQITELMIDACTNQACAAIKLFNVEIHHRKYVKLFFVKIYEEIRKLAAGGAQPNLNLSKIKETLLPLPPISEQARIVTKIDELMALCDQIKERISNADALQRKLADVMVAQAVA